MTPLGFTRLGSLVGVACLALPSIAAADIVFVRANQILPSSFQTGGSWATAFKDLQAAIAAASTGDEIWVAAGTYRPTSGSDRTVSFALKNGVHLIGGFSGSETLISQRDIRANETILSGEIGGAGTSDNSLRLISALNLSTLTVVDGFTITGATADDPPDNTGAAVMCLNSTLTIASCVIRDNRAVIAAVASVNLSQDRVFRALNCLVIGNDATGIECQNPGTAIISQSTVANNNSGVRLFNATNASNLIANSILYGNGSGSEPDQISFQAGSVATVAGSVIQGWNNSAPAGIGTINADPRFIDPDGGDNLHGTADDNYRLRGDSPAIDRAHSGFIGITDTLDVDDDGVSNELYPFDLAGGTRRIDDTLVANTGGGVAPHSDAGALERVRPRTVFVDIDATGANSGTSWANAYNQLFDAIAELNDPKFGGDGEIWVAEGTYVPTLEANTSIGFIPGSGVHLYGGFIGNGPGGNELDRSLRRWLTHETILSGDLPAIQGTLNTRGVVRYSGPFLTDSILDGFVIQSGVAFPGEPGGGLRVTNDASPTVRNCIVRQCVAIGETASGAGVFLGGTTVGTPTLVQCAIVGNSVSLAGAGAGILVEAEKARIVQCIIAGNGGASPGGARGIHFDTNGTTAVLQNSVLVDNSPFTPPLVSDQLKQAGNGTVTVTGCSIEGLSGSLPGIALLNSQTYATNDLIDLDGPDNLYGTADDDFRPSPCGGLIDAGTTTGLPADAGDLDGDGNDSEGIALDADDRPRRVNMPVADSGSGSGIPIDIGMLELQPSDLPDPDLNGDGAVDASDLAILLGAWLSVGGPADFNGDCAVDASDLAILLGAWN